MGLLLYLQRLKLTYDEWPLDWEVDDVEDINENRSIASLIEENIEIDDE